jgi:hypothetical protein
VSTKRGPGQAVGVRFYEKSIYAVDAVETDECIEKWVSFVYSINDGI